jgi:hypothetical protein
MSSCVWRATSKTRRGHGVTSGRPNGGGGGGSVRNNGARNGSGASKQPRKRKSTDALSNASEFKLNQNHNNIVAFIKKKKHELDKEKHAIPRLQDDAARKRAKAASLRARWQILDRQDLLDEADEIDAIVLALQSDERVLAFTEEAATYLDAFMGSDSQFLPQAEPLPSTRKRKQAASQRKAPKVECRVITASRSGKVFKEVLTDDFMRKHDAGYKEKAYCISDQACDVCGAMLVHDTAADVCVCVRCHREREFVGGASAAKNSLRASGWRYRRLGNYKLLLAKFLGQHTCPQVTDKVYDKIMWWLYDTAGCRHNDHVNSDFVGQACTKLGFGSAVKLCKNGITSEITNKHMDQMTADELAQFYQIFCVIDCTYERLRSMGIIKGINMMRYWFIKWGSFSVLTWGKRFLKHFNLKDNRDNVARLSRNWEKVCRVRGFHYVPIA